MLFILPRQVATYGDLWRFSTGPLEARGAMLQRSVRTSYTFRPTVIQNPGQKTKGDYRGNTLKNAATLVEANKFLDRSEFNTRKEHRLDYFGRSSKASLPKLGCEGPMHTALQRFALVKIETVAASSSDMSGTSS